MAKKSKVVVELEGWLAELTRNYDRIRTVNEVVANLDLPAACAVVDYDLDTRKNTIHRIRTILETGPKGENNVKKEND